MARSYTTFICEKCGKTFQSRGKNIRFCSNSCRASIINKGRKPPNFIEGKIRKCLICGKTLHHQSKTGYCSKHYITSEYKKKISERAIKSGNGGYRKNSGKGKSGWYKGIWCDSSWELAWVVYHLDHNINFKRNNQSFEYVFENKKCKYYPDFIKNNEYIEIKGWMNKRNEEKIKQFPKKLKVLFKEDLIDILNYVKSKYGDDFIKLYETGCTGAL